MTAAESIVRWLLTEAPTDDGGRLVGALAMRLLEAGVPVWRLRTGLNALHPEIFSEAIAWSRERGAVRERVSHEFVASMPPSSNPIYPIVFGGQDEIRCRLTGGPPPYESLREIMERGATDYIIFGLPSVNGTRIFLSVATDAQDGFEDEHLATLRAIVPALARVIELATAYYATARLLEVYLGQNAAARVQKGAVRRGSGEIIRAAIWYCDLRGFTALANRLPVRELVALLDRYFDCMSAPVTERGGEILKFIGDAMLAVFPVAEGWREPCHRALLAAERALEDIGRLGEASARRGEAPIEVGIALHVGEVLYGNVGSHDRLDFTVIGAAVNEVTRVESLCKHLGTPLLATTRFASMLSPGTFTSLGCHGLRGIPTPMEVLTLPRLLAGGIT